jgi:aspartate 1-decarboxylase
MEDLFAGHDQGLEHAVHADRVSQALFQNKSTWPHLKQALDAQQIDAAGIMENERVQVVNNNNGERLETYAIKGKRGSGIICLNGAAARKAEVGDIVIIISYGWMTQEEAKAHKPMIVFPDENNHVVK